MKRRVFFSFFVTALLASAADKKAPAAARGENLDLILNVTLYDDPSLVKGLLGTDLEGHYIVAEVKVEPKYGKEVLIDWNDFVLWTERDGEKSTPFAPNQITGKDAVILSHTKGPGAASPGMVLEGPPALHGGALAGGPPAKEEGGESQPGPQSGPPAKDPPKDEDPLKKLLTGKMLVEKKTGELVSGLLYFPMEKQKRKDLELDYGGRENRITLRFK